jgi:hypothetical protein
MLDPENFILRIGALVILALAVLRVALGDFNKLLHDFRKMRKRRP